MIATILQSSKSFRAVKYNEDKVNEGVARLLEASNFLLIYLMVLE